ncbi:dethiobiotin synthase [Shewanella canadensis]|uniref:ATP-dependent dethiobiotin synthetase BioD n=1 Tax=Shewanella canadensis TaxID=271096 RepID=A0A431WVP6_9GAMM|nr:dethiobiotin synthase [Shewanella canadensis]
MIYFVTGTDTDCGKTFISAALLNRAKKQGRATLGLKPIASGCEKTENGLRNSDALSLMSQSTIELDYAAVNPVSFEPAIAPHIAASQTGIDISPESILNRLSGVLEGRDDSELCIIEGAGGWRLTLGEGHFLSEVVQQLSVPVILVVGVKLGCLNHAVLTQEAIEADGLKIAGWVANIVDGDTRCLEENLASLQSLMSGPCLGVVPHLQDLSIETAAAYLDIDSLI